MPLPPPQPSIPAPLDVAVVGVGALLPGAHNTDQFWRNVVGGRDLMKDVPPTHWLIDDYYDPDPSAPDRTYARRGAFLDAVDFDPLVFGTPPATLPATDSAQLLSLVAADQALLDATNGDLSRLDRERVGVIIGTSGLELMFDMTCRLQRPVWLKALRDAGVPEAEAQTLCDRITDQYVPWQEATFPGVLSNVVAGRIANRFDLGGPNCTVDAACAGSLAALSMAAAELQLGRCDTVLTGGVDTTNGITMYMCFSKTPALSPSGDCRPFSEAADGTMLGEGLVMFALRRLRDAERDGDHVYAVLKGLGASSDGGGGAIYAPLSAGQEMALRRAYEQADYGPSTVELVEAHGTGTKAGDRAEVDALLSVFRQDRPERSARWCALGSVKSQIGHTKSAAGAVGLLKAVMALQHKALPPTIKVDQPLDVLRAADSPLYVNTSVRPWVRGAGHGRRASVSSFGFGGSNFHLTVEEYRPRSGSNARPRGRFRTAGCELLLLGAQSPEELVRQAGELGESSEPLAQVARESQQRFSARTPYRLAVLASDTGQAADRLQRAARHIGHRPEHPFTWTANARYGTGTGSGGRLAYLFSGQGSQYVGMGAGLALQLPQALAVWDSAADWGARFGLAVHERVFPPAAFGGEEERRAGLALAATHVAQPALAVQCLAQLAVLRSLGLEPDCTAGHSFGELVALHAAGVFDDRTLFRLAVQRGALMAGAAADFPGGMTAVACSAERATRILNTARIPDAWITGHNAPDQVVVAGTTSVLERVEEVFAVEAVHTVRLETATAFHSPAVAAAAAPFAAALDRVELRSPDKPVWSNLTGARYPTDPDGIRRVLTAQLTSPVLFADQIEAMYVDGVRTFVEIGAGGSLISLTSRILHDRPHLGVTLDRRNHDGLSTMNEALGALAVQGHELDLDALWAEQAPAPLPSRRKSRMIAKIDGSHQGKPYPPPAPG